VHGGAAEGAIDFSVSINPLGPPPAALEAYHASAAKINCYPPVYPGRLTARIADWLGVDAEEVIVGNGSTQLIHLFARVCKPRLPYIAIPTFSEFANALTLNDCNPCGLELRRENGFTIRTKDITSALNHRGQAVFIGRPNNPTGSMIPLAQAQAIAGECERLEAFCVFDETFIDFADRAERAIRLMHTIPEEGRKGLIIIGSLTKIFSIPGLRIGFLAGWSKVIERLREYIEPWSVNIVAERVALACLEEADELIRRTREWLEPERNYLCEQLGSIQGINIFPPAANFVMLEVKERDETSFGEFMLQRGIAVRDLRTMTGCGGGFYRVAVRLRDENERLIAAARAY
jgi:threonine-phosphate decarboxylase